MEQNENDKRFYGVEMLYGTRALSKFQKSHILIVGIGGVGSWAAESLIRSGIGEITIVDMDDICVSNINRQVQALNSTVGREKVYILKERLLDINPELKINAIFDYFTPTTAEEILSKKFDFIIDAMDSVHNKCLLIAKARDKKIPIITIGSAGARLDPSKIQINDLRNTTNDFLTRRMKKILRHEHGFSKYEKRPFKVPCIFSVEEVKKEHKENIKVSNCQTNLGSISFVTASMGLQASAYIINELGQDVD